MSQFSHSLHFPLFIFLMKLVPILSNNCPVGHLLSMLDSAKVRSESRPPRQHWAGQSSCPQPKLPPTRGQPGRQLNLEIARRAKRDSREPLAGERRVDDIMRAGHWEGLRSGFTGNGNTEREREQSSSRVLVTQQRVAAPGHGMVSY